MILAMLLAAAEPQTAIDAERAFAADAHKLGQWTAFRKYAAANAQMFVPQPGNAQEWLKDKKDPPVAVFWWPGRSYVSCDGQTAINTGPWVREWGKSVGYFSTVWQRQPDGTWKWLLDHGDVLKSPRAEGGDIKARIASCEGDPSNATIGLTSAPGARAGKGASTDKTLIWAWTVDPDGSRQLMVKVWDGKNFESVLHDRVAAE